MTARAGGQLAGAFTPFIMGALADAFSFTAAFLFLLLGVAIAIIATIFSPQTKTEFNMWLEPIPIKLHYSGDP